MPHSLQYRFSFFSPYGRMKFQRFHFLKSGNYNISQSSPSICIFFLYKNLALHPSLPNHGPTFILWHGIPILENSISDLKLHTCGICNQHKNSLSTQVLLPGKEVFTSFKSTSKFLGLTTSYLSIQKDAFGNIYIATQKCINNAI